jgi:hypothetical protein
VHIAPAAFTFMARSRSSSSTVIRKALLYLLLFLGSAELLIYFLTPVYEFPEPAPFGGTMIFNPYQDMDSRQWKKANFHFHTKAWFGITSGRQNTSQDFYLTYKKMGYDVPCISNYQSISKFNADSSFYIPVYEHGFGVRKKHQLSIGAKKVLWLDYSLSQNLNHKQHILNLLHGQTEIVAIAHPDWEHGYSSEDMKYLSNYDLIEALDANWRSVPLWDAALSSGHPVYILADDDAHDISNPYQIGRCCTFINSATTNTADILNSLKNGKAFGANVYMYDNETMDQKAEDVKLIPMLNSVKVIHDTLRVTVSRKALKFDFIGQDGKVKKTVLNDSSAFYQMLAEDSYIRTEITFPTKEQWPGTKFYLNPVFRYDGVQPSNSLRAEINLPRTLIFRLLTIPSLAALILLIFLPRRRKKIQR